MSTAVSRSSPPVLHLSLVVGGALLDRDGRRLGRVDDLIVRLGGAGYPPITGVLVTFAGRQSYLPAEHVDDMREGSVTLSAPQIDVRPFERRPDEVLLKKDVLDRQLINVDGARLVRANEIELSRIGGWWRVVGVDTGPRGAARRLLPRRLGAHVASGRFLDWASIEPFVGHVPSVRLRIPHPKLAKLHPADIADLVEAASHDEGEEIMAALRADRELEADVFEELDDHHQVEFLEARPDVDIAETLARMAPDDAADAVAELEQQQRERVLELLPGPQRTKVRALLGYDPAVAGGLMTTDFVSIYRQATVAEALERLRRSELPADLLTHVYVMDTRHELVGAVAIADLLRANPEDGIAGLDSVCVGIAPDTEFEEIARRAADYNLTAIPVVDDAGRMIGVVTVDDVLEVLLPKGWRRRFGMLGEDE
jgi:CBS domain-containing protein